MNADCREMCIAAKSTAQNIINACDYMLAGHSEHESCLKFDINKSKFRRFLRSNYKGENVVSNEKEKTHIESMVSPEEKLYCKIMNIEPSNQGDVMFPSDLEESFEFAFKTWLSPKELNLIKDRYWNNLTLQEIANKKQRTRECIRLQESDIIKKLSTKKSKKMVFML